MVDSTTRVSAAIDHAIAMGLRGLAITDHASLSAHVEALNHMTKLRQKAKDAGKELDFHLVLGNEIYLLNANEYQLDEEGKPLPIGHFPHFILLARDEVGHRQLRELSDRAWERSFVQTGMRRVPTLSSDLAEIISSNQGHVVATTACLGGTFPRAVLADDPAQAKGFVDWCVNIFGAENFFIELQPSTDPNQILFNQRALSFAKYFGIRWTVANDVHYLTADKRVLHAAFLNSQDRERELEDFYASTYFKTPEEMLAILCGDGGLPAEDVATGFANTAAILASCKSCEQEGKWSDEVSYGLFKPTIVPERTLPEFTVQHLFAPWYDICPSIKAFANSEFDQDRFCISEIEKGIHRTGKALNEATATRIDTELSYLLSISEKLGQRLSSYYNLVQLVIQLMWELSYVGPARGSVTGFLMAYLMDITQVDPMEWDLPSWRHIHHSRPELPDIDTDTESSKRPALFTRFKEYFGEDRCLNIITFRTESAKSACLTACRGLGIDTDTAHELASLIPMARGRVFSIKDCYEGCEDNGFVPVRDFINKVAEIPNLLETMQEIEGLVSGYGVHASGFYIFNGPYVEQVSMMRAPNGTPVTCWDMEQSDQCGCLKIDVLTISNLDCLRLCTEMLAEDGAIEAGATLKDTYNRYLHPKVLDYTTPTMWEAAADGKISSLFQFDTDVGSQAIAQIRPTNLKQMALANSIMRLMGNEDMVPLERYVRFKNDIALWYKEMADAGLNAAEVKVLEKYLLPNSGCSVEQEDMMELLMDAQIVGFDMKWANKARKAVA